MKLQHCNKAQIYNLENELICEADVIGDVESTATLRFHESCDDILRTEVNVQFLDGTQGLVSCLCRLSEYEEDLDPMAQDITSTVTCTILSQNNVVQRRQDIKVSVHIETEASFINEKDDLEIVEITIKDISAGGLFCVSKQLWEAHQIFAIKLFDTKIPIDVQVLRVQSPDSNGTQKEGNSDYGYGCKFVNLSRAAEAALRKFVFQQDLQKKRSVVGTD